VNTPQWLTPPHLRHLTPNRYHSAYKPSRIEPVEAVVLHFTVAGSGKSSARYMANEVRDSGGNVIKAGAAAHFVVDRDGTVRQLAPLSDRTWHAGGKGPNYPEWRGRSPNNCTIGIEIANYGPLFNQAGRWYNWWGKPHNGGVFANPLPLGDDLASDLIRSWCAQQGVDAPQDTHGRPFELLAWEDYPAAQEAAVQWLVDVLADVFPVLRERDEIMGQQSRICAHSSIDPWRKLDSGPAFPIEMIRSAVQGSP